MARILESLPGLTMSVRDVTRMVSSLWDDISEDHASSNAGYRASQMNLVIHFGDDTTPVEAVARFDRALAFARVYPCRIIVLEETFEQGRDQSSLVGKLFSQCYVGKDLRDLCCCEALMLSYPRGLADHVSHQVSLWLEADLPVYYWLHRVPCESVEGAFSSILKQSRRVIADRSVDGIAYAGVNGLKEGRLHDLAYARTLRIRQTLGQILSSIPSRDLVENLSAVEIMYVEKYAGEASFILDWVRAAIKNCAAQARLPDDFHFEMTMLEGLDNNSIKMSWRFTTQSHFLNWEFNARARIGHLEAALGSGHLRQPIHLEPLNDVMLLAEAMFFG